jgi:hypothetical protein
MKQTEQDKILSTCKELAKIVFKSREGKIQPHYDVVVKAMQDCQLHDTGLQVLEDIASIVQIGLDTHGQLSPDMLDTLEERVHTLVTALTKK